MCLALSLDPKYVLQDSFSRKLMLLLEPARFISTQYCSSSQNYERRKCRYPVQFITSVRLKAQSAELVTRTQHCRPTDLGMYGRQMLAEFRNGAAALL